MKSSGKVWVIVVLMSYSSSLRSMLLQRIDRTALIKKHWLDAKQRRGCCDICPHFDKKDKNKCDWAPTCNVLKIAFYAGCLSSPGKQLAAMTCANSPSTEMNNSISEPPKLSKELHVIFQESVQERDIE